MFHWFKHFLIFNLHLFLIIMQIIHKLEKQGIDRVLITLSSLCVCVCACVCMCLSHFVSVFYLKSMQLAQRVLNVANLNVYSSCHAFMTMMLETEVFSACCLFFLSEEGGLWQQFISCGGSVVIGC